MNFKYSAKKSHYKSIVNIEQGQIIKQYISKVN